MTSVEDRRFDELYAGQFREVLAYCLRRGLAEDAYDAANEVFTIAWRRIADVPAGDAARPWLFVVAKRVVHRRLRGRSRFHRLVDKVGASPQPTSVDPAAIVVQRAEYEAVLAAASQLSETDREVLQLAAWEGLPHAQIADVLGCSIAAVDQRLHRAKKRLAKHFDAAARVEHMGEAAGGGIT